jgi:hypothetical protein
MTLSPPTLAMIPALVALTIAAGRIVAPLAREARLITVVWLALRGTRPGQRAEIIRALTGHQGGCCGGSSGCRGCSAGSAHQSAFRSPGRRPARKPAAADQDVLGAFRSEGKLHGLNFLRRSK